MGRKKIEIRPLAEDRNRNVTFLKRKAGLMKKAWELSVLCHADVSMIIWSQQGKLFEFSSGDLEGSIRRYQDYSGPIERKRASDFTNNSGRKGGGGGDSDDDDDMDDMDDDDPKGKGKAGAGGTGVHSNLKGKEEWKAPGFSGTGPLAPGRNRESDRDRERDIRDRERDRARERDRRDRDHSDSFHGKSSSRNPPSSVSMRNSGGHDVSGSGSSMDRRGDRGAPYPGSSGLPTSSVRGGGDDGRRSSVWDGPSDYSNTPHQQHRFESPSSPPSHRISRTPSLPQPPMNSLYAPNTSDAFRPPSNPQMFFPPQATQPYLHNPTSAIAANWAAQAEVAQIQAKYHANQARLAYLEQRRAQQGEVLRQMGLSGVTGLGVGTATGIPIGGNGMGIGGMSALRGGAAGEDAHLELNNEDLARILANYGDTGPGGQWQGNGSGGALPGSDGTGKFIWPMANGAGTTAEGDSWAGSSSAGFDVSAVVTGTGQWPVPPSHDGRSASAGPSTSYAVDQHTTDARRRDSYHPGPSGSHNSNDDRVSIQIPSLDTSFDLSMPQHGDEERDELDEGMEDEHHVKGEDFRND